jgi:hypothetical protein
VENRGLIDMKRSALVTACGISLASAAVIEGTGPAGHANNVTIVSLEDRQSIVLLTLSGPLVGGPACAAQHPNVIVISNSQSADAQKARKALALHKAIEVWGGGICNRAPTYETLSGFQAIDGTDLLDPAWIDTPDSRR